ncbi:transposable element Tcb1 transposase [Trichonephila clavipes]|nr:transposable element Tcb1 transposase [Trichonephila clavipes]
MTPIFLLTTINLHERQLLLPDDYVITSTPRVRLLSDSYVCHFLINQPDRFYCLATHGSLSAAIDRHEAHNQSPQTLTHQIRDGGLFKSPVSLKPSSVPSSEVKLITRALKAFQYNNRIVTAQRKHLDDFLRGRIIGRLECGRTQLEVS